MNKKDKIMLGAVAGLMTVTLTSTPLEAAPHTSDNGIAFAQEKESKGFFARLFGGGSDKETCKTKDGCKGKDGCKSKDSCKGKDGCKSKDSCKGKDGCKSKTDKSKDACGGKDGCGAKE